MKFNAATIESWVDFIDDTVDDVAPRLAAEVPAVAVAVPIVDGIRKLADLVLQSPLVTDAQKTTVTNSVSQLDNAVNATPTS